jgi:hypothetical protein
MPTPDELKSAEERWRKLRDDGDPGAADAYAEFQRLARSQTEALQTSNYQSLISKLNH